MGHFFIPSGSERMRGCRFAPCEPGLESSFLVETKITLSGHFYFLAEARGFEPPRHCCPHDFESCAFNHSATLPLLILSHPTSKDKHTHQLILQNHLLTSTKNSMKSTIISVVI